MVTLEKLLLHTNPPTIENLLPQKITGLPQIYSHKKYQPLLHPEFTSTEVTRFPTKNCNRIKSALYVPLSFEWIIHLSLSFGFGFSQQV